MKPPSLPLLALAALFPAGAPAAETPPNIVFILVDNMGYGDLGGTGVEDIRTPHIDRIAANGVFLTDFLKELGYATGAFGKWHLGYKDIYNPVNRGFDEYFGELLGHADFYKHVYFDGSYALRDGLEPVKKEGEYFTLADHAPFLAPDAPDTPFVTRESMLTGSREIYKAMLERVDDGVGMIYDELEKAGLVENTLIVFPSDYDMQVR